MIGSEIIVAKTAGTLAATYAVLAVIEVGTQNAIVALFQNFVSTAGGILLAWIAYKQYRLSKKQDELHNTVTTLEKNTNSIREELVATTGIKERAEGKLEGKEEQKATDIAEAAILAQGRLEGEKAAATIPSLKV